MKYPQTPKFHGYYDQLANRHQFWPKLGGGVQTTVHKHFVTQNRELGYRFSPHFHPHVAKLVERLIHGSVEGLQAADTDESGAFTRDLFTSTRYTPQAMVTTPYPREDLDFTTYGPYSIYNWELFFHVPFTLALHLSKNQRFEEAQRWFHMIFDPTDDSEGESPKRFWKVQPFRTTDVEMTERVLVNLATGADPELRQATIDSIAAWTDAPFRPHVVARYRQSAYMFRTVMAYLDNVIAWGDSLFRQDTRESINEATQLYVMAANLLGPRPQAVPKKGSVRAQTYADLRAELDRFGNALRELESDIPFDLALHSTTTSDNDRLAGLRSLGYALYFCVPRNDKLLSYWDTVADRLFKIRNSLNIQGVFRQLPLFEPPIDPALLARGAAAGLDVAAIVSGVNQPLPLIRFVSLLQRTLEIVGEVKSLGNLLLSVIEKEDSEALAILRAKHERVILAQIETVKYQQLQEAIKTREGLEKSLASAAQRYVYYERLLGREEVEIPQIDSLDTTALEKLKFRADEPLLSARPIAVDIDRTQPLGDGAKVSSHEAREMQYLGLAQTSQDMAASMDVLAGMMNIIPGFGVSIQPFGVGGTISFGGSNIAAIFNSLGAGARGAAGRLSYEAAQSGRTGTYSRRQQEWTFQSNSAAAELTQIYKQLRAAQIREAIAEREWHNHQQQMRHAQEIEDFLTDEKIGKKTNQAFYAWLKREVKGLYSGSFQLAFEVARKAERCLQHELGDPSLRFLGPTYLAGKEGLLAGERLHLDVKRMEIAYHELNRREYELTKHVSLAQLDPVALVELRTTGRCTLRLPEEVFDFDGPGHYFRRIRSVALSIPCVAGPYTSVNCTLTLRKSSIRKSALLGEGAPEYEREGAEDDRFVDDFSSLRAVVTSTSNNDTGVFDSERPDERYGPFEGCGAISEWGLELPWEVKQFDYDTIADVILHVRYTAREGGSALRSGSVQNLEAKLAEARALGSVRLLSVRHEFPTAWARFMRAPANAGARVLLELVLEQKHYPFWSQGRISKLERVELFARSELPSLSIYGSDDTPDSSEHDQLVPDTQLGLLRGELDNLPLPQPTGAVSLYFAHNEVTELWLAVAWA